MNNLKEYLSIIKELTNNRILLDTELAKKVYGNTYNKEILIRRIRNLRYFGFNLARIKINKHYYYYLK